MDILEYTRKLWRDDVSPEERESDFRALKDSCTMKGSWPRSNKAVVQTKEYLVLSEAGIIKLRDWFKDPCNPTPKELKKFKAYFSYEYEAK